MDINVRKELFRKEVVDVGGTIYTKRMLDEFFNYWGESDRAKKPKMRFEKEKTWETPLRLGYWSRQTRKYNVFLSEDQKTIQEKKKAFAISLEEFLPKYGKEMLNEFYRYWTQPENVETPDRLRWQAQEFWDLATRLQTWASKPHNQPQQSNQQYARR